MAIYGQERAKPGEWWHLFCSEKCARVWHPDMQDVQWFANLKSFGEHIGWDAAEIAKHQLGGSCCLWCSHCRGPLELAPPKPSSPPQWYIDEAVPRLAELEQISLRCNWDSAVPSAEQAGAREQWNALMRIQADAEAAAGL